MTPSPSERRIDARRRLRALVLGPLLAVVLAGCGSSSTPGPTGGSPVEASSLPSSTRDPAASASPSARVTASPTPILPEVVDRGSWRKGTPMPIRRGEVQATVLNGLLYVAGGIDRGHSLATFETFDPRDGRWTELAPLPEPHDHIGIAALGGKVYVTGGGDFFAPSTTDTAWVYDPALDRWSTLPRMPARRIAHAMVALHGKLYLVGGIIGGRAPNETWSFDPTSGRWDATLAPIPTYREHLAATTVGDQAWVIGGRETRPLPTVEVYDPATDSWRMGPPLPAGRGGHTAATVDGTIHVTGGEDWELNRTWPTHFALDPGASTWIRLPDMPTSRHGLASGGINGQWIVVGGGRGPFVNISDIVEIYKP